MPPDTNLTPLKIYQESEEGTRIHGKWEQQIPPRFPGSSQGRGSISS